MDILIILILFNYYLYLIQSNNICRYYYSLCRLHQNNYNLNLNFRKFSKSNRTIHPNSLQIWLLQSTAKSDAFNPYKFGHPYVLTFVFHRPSTSTLLHYQSLRYKECKDARCDEYARRENRRVIASWVLYAGNYKSGHNKLEIMPICLTSSRTIARRIRNQFRLVLETVVWKFHALARPATASSNVCTTIIVSFV